MKASPLPGLTALLSLFLMAATAREAAAQDYVIRNSGQKVEGKIVGTSGQALKIELAKGATTIPFQDVKELQMPPPPQFEAAAAQLARGDAKGAAASLQKISGTFAGLDAPWFQRATVMLGDAKLAAGDKEGAKAAYEQFAKAYPSATGLANLGMARLAVESGDQAGAAKLLAPILAKSAKTALPAPADASTLCQAHYLMGRIKEAEGDKPAALENYLKASALFPFDQNAVADATKRADTLRAENAGLIAP
ncbi:MAG: hypothetical protein JHD33_02140 [Chthoniobacterales bacterium]|nr:hypothetical protein [Chthoniobacterales bacterium]